MSESEFRRVQCLAQEEHRGSRIDRFLAENLPQDTPLSRTRIKALILDGELSVDDEVVLDPSRTVQAGAEYVLSIPPAESLELVGQNIELDVLFEDEHVIVINKPAGMVVHPGPGQPDGTLVNALISHCGDGLTGIGGVMRPGIVHRLDKDTSGVMMAAKSERAHHRLGEMFAAHELDRRYLALVWSVVPQRSGRIEAPIGRSRRDRKRQAVTSSGRHAVTNWQMMRLLPPFASLLECRLETGRTHQIRVHMEHLGHGVVGDPVYGRALRAAMMPDEVSRACLGAMRAFERQALHAAVLGFTHPITGEAHEFQVDPPEDMARLIDDVTGAVAARASGQGRA